MKRTGDSPMSARERLLNAQVIREHGPMDGAEAAELDVLARAIEAEAREPLARALAESEERVRVLEFDRDKLLEAGGIALMIRPDLIRDGSLSLFSALEPLRHAVESVESDRMDAALLKGEPDAR